MPASIILAAFVVLCQATQPVSERGLRLGPDAAAALNAIANTNQPDGENGWPLFVEAGKRAKQVDRSIPNGGDRRVHMGFYDWTVITRTGLDAKYKEVARSGFDRLRDAGFFELVSRASNCHRFAGTADSKDEIGFWSISDASLIREVARPLNAWMSLAFQEGRWDDACLSFESSLVMAQACCLQPSLIDRMVGLAGYSLALGELRTCIAEKQPPPEVLTRIRKAILDHPIPSFDIALQGERIQIIRTVEYVYSEDRQKVDGKSAEEILALMSRGGEVGAMLMNSEPASAPASAPKTEFATRAEMSKKGEEVLLQLAELIRLPCEKRIEQVNLVYQDTKKLPDKFVLAQSVATASAQCMRDECGIQAEINGSLLMLAIELSRAKRGDWPGSLADLVPDDLSRLPADCRTGRSFCYRLSDGQRTYTLYTTGADLTDDGGKLMVDDNYLTLSERGSGFDYILNLPRERHMEAIFPDENK